MEENDSFSKRTIACRKKIGRQIESKGSGAGNILRKRSVIDHMIISLHLSRDNNEEIYAMYLSCLKVTVITSRAKLLQSCADLLKEVCINLQNEI